MPEELDVEKLVGELETNVDRLRALYDQYFMGIEKLVPSVPLKDVERRINVLRKEQIRNSGLRFRFLMVVQRYNTYLSYWQRICREIENGTYKRHMLRAKEKFADKAAASRRFTVAKPPEMPPLSEDLKAELDELDREFAPVEVPVEVEVEISHDSMAPLLPAVEAPPPSKAVWKRVEPAPPTRQTIPAGVAPPPRAPPPPPSQRQLPPLPSVRQPPRPDLPDERVRQLYSQYVEAKRQRNESTAAITYEDVAKTLRESSSRLRAKHGRAVDFEVAVRDGKTVLKPVIK